MAVDRMLRRSKRAEPSAGEPSLSFGTWEQFPELTPRVLQVCHPEWRGVRTATHAFGSPVAELRDLEGADGFVDAIIANRVDLVVIQGWPPGAGEFARLCHRRGIGVKCVLHSSPALQGEVPAEADVVSSVFSLRDEGVIDEVAMVKAGVAEAFAAAGQAVTYLPNHSPDVSDVLARDQGPGLHLGVFGANWWPKNLATQVLAAHLIPGSRIHINDDLGPAYLLTERVEVHGELARDEFLSLMAGMDLNLYATLTECHPLIPVESYLLGVPCLISRTSHLFRDDPILWDLTTVERPDEPEAIAESATRLIEQERSAMARALEWIRRADDVASAAWRGFVSEQRNDR